MDMTTRDLTPAEYRVLQRRALQAQRRECLVQLRQAVTFSAAWWRAEARICECQAQLAELDEADAAERETTCDG